MKLPFGLALGAVALVVCATTAAAPRIRTVFVTAVDAKGAGVDDLSPEDFSVKEGGKERQVVKAEVTTAPMQVAIIVDDNGTGLFRASVGLFIQKLLGRAEFAITAVVGQPLRIVDYTRDVPALTAALTKLGARPSTPDGGQLLEAVSEAARNLHKREAPRPIIVALTVGGEEHSPIQATEVLNRLRDSTAKLYVISMADSQRAMLALRTPAQALETAINLAEVLGDGPKQSGGRHEQIIASTGVVRSLGDIADELMRQYALSYVLPDGVKPAEKLSVSVKRRGVTVRAPTRIPNK